MKKVKLLTIAIIAICSIGKAQIKFATKPTKSETHFIGYSGVELLKVNPNQDTIYILDKLIKVIIIDGEAYNIIRSTELKKIGLNHLSIYPLGVIDTGYIPTLHIGRYIPFDNMPIPNIVPL